MNTNIFLTRLDKRAGVVILNSFDKMSIILDVLKFCKLADLSSDNTLKMEVRIQNSFFNCIKENFFLKKFMREFVLSVHKDPKCTVYQKSTNLTFHLDPFCQAQQESTKWLVEVLVPVLQFYSNCCVPDLFQFASIIRQLPHCVNTEFIVSFNISLFTTSLWMRLLELVPIIYIGAI